MANVLWRSTFAFSMLPFVSVIVIFLATSFPVEYTGPSRGSGIATKEDDRVTSEGTARFNISIRIKQRGPFWIIYDFISPRRSCAADESVTFATHGDISYLDNILILVERWQAPISLTLYTPGSDLSKALDLIRHLLQCSPLVSEYVSFHLFFDQDHVPDDLRGKFERFSSNLDQGADCHALVPPFPTKKETYVAEQNLPYYINLARNIAKEMSRTDYVLVCDIELMPNYFLVPNFMAMVKQRYNGSHSTSDHPPRVFVLPPFEVESSVTVLPAGKSDLQHYLRTGKAIPFHQHICRSCHTIPAQQEWIVAEPMPGLSVFNVTRREGAFNHWEPFYIGTKSDPDFDERLFIEGYHDKFVQAYILCLMGYEFHTLDNAFLVHRPGIKRAADLQIRDPSTIQQQRKLVETKILPELDKIYGHRPQCSL